MLRSIGKQSGGIHGVSSAEERKATVGRICRKEGFKLGKKRGPVGKHMILSVKSKTCVLRINISNNHYDCSR